MSPIEKTLALTQMEKRVSLVIKWLDMTAVFIYPLLTFRHLHETETWSGLSPLRHRRASREGLPQDLPQAGQTSGLPVGLSASGFHLLLTTHRGATSAGR